MKKITDESVAKALGWKQFEDNEGFWCSHSRHKNKPVGIWPWPKFTTSLDTITAEIEARKLLPSVMKLNAKKDNNNWQAIIYPDTLPPHQGRQAFAKTAPLALCAALLAYLKDAK